MKILFAGGGTGGHILPIIAVARELKRLHQKEDLELFYVGSEDANSSVELEQEGIVVKKIVSGKLRRYFAFQNFTDVLFKIPLGFLQSFFILAVIKPDIVFSKGGTGSLPVTFGARILRIPVFLHESDIVPGMSNKITSKWAKKIFTSFEKTEYFDLAKTVCVGNIIRKEVLEGSQEGARDILNLSLQKPVILFWGGSQGAQALNDFLILTVNELLKRYEVIHICGKNNLEKTKTEGDIMIAKSNERQNYHLFDFLNEVQLKHALKVSSLVVSRSGSASIFEIAATGIPAILIPLPKSAGDHQTKNAYEYSKTGAAIIIEQTNLLPNFFLEKINFLISSPERLEEMKKAALSFAKPLAAKAVAREILEYLESPKS